LRGFAKFFRESSEEEREHAQKLMRYMNSRGGRVFMQDVKRPSTDEWGTGLSAMQAALALEHEVNQSLLSLHSLSLLHSDPHFSDFIQSEYLTEQVESIKELSDFVTRMQRAGPGLGEHMVDKELYSSSS
jgi:ferritin heavy chain